MVLHCPHDAKEMLPQMAPEVCFQTPHFEGWPALVVRLCKVGDAELGQRPEEAWRFKAPWRLGAARPARN